MNRNHNYSELQSKFQQWLTNMAGSAGLYLVVFLVCQASLNWVKNYFGSQLAVNQWLIGLVATLLGILFIADSIITSYLKTPLARLAIQIEYSSLGEEVKKKLLQSTQAANELFKETFKKFGLLALPSLLVGLIDNQPLLVYSRDSFTPEGQLKVNVQPLGQVSKSGNKNSEKIIFYLCYLIPLLYAAGKIYRISQELKKLATHSDFSTG